tara:strand:+ start:3767 stop:4015 length:249 start_codon:yes stop_codon:yes gene_type:complete
MSNLGLRYLDFHMRETFKDFVNLRQLLHVDWFEDCGIRAALYMSKEQEGLGMEDVHKFSESKDVTDIILLCPPATEEELNGK